MAEAVAQVQPQASGRFQYASHVAQHDAQLVNPAVDASFKSDLILVAVVAEPEVGRRAHDAVHRRCWQRRQEVTYVADEQPVAQGAHDVPPASTGNASARVVVSKISGVKLLVRRMRSRSSLART